jgi:hypothetical protein
MPQFQAMAMESPRLMRLTNSSYLTYDATLDLRTGR